MATEVNAAVQANLDRVLREERIVTVRRIAWFRVFAGAVGTLVMLPRAADPTLRPSLFGSMAFFSVALTLLLVLRARPKSAVWPLGSLSHSTFSSAVPSRARP